MTIVMVCQFLICQHLDFFPLQEELIVILVKNKAYLQLWKLEIPDAIFLRLLTAVAWAGHLDLDNETTCLWILPGKLVQVENLSINDGAHFSRETAISVSMVALISSVFI